MRFLNAGIVLTVCALLAGRGGAAADAAPDDFWRFYEQHPQLQDFFPFGVYGDQGNWGPFGVDPRAYTEMVTDALAENGFNVIWGTNTHRNVEMSEKGEPKGLNAYGTWYYGEELPFHELRILPVFGNLGLRYNAGALAKYQRDEPPLNDAEMAEVETDRRAVLDLASQLAKAYPGTVIGTVSDDEPSLLAPAVAALRLLEKHTALPATTCIPSWAVFKLFAGHMQPITGDWYVTSDTGRDSWAVARNLRWLRENHPDRVFYFLPLATAYYSAHEATKPGLKDSRPTRTELRAQFWMAIAGGCKGFFYYHVGGWPDWAGGEDPLLNPVLRPNNDLWEELGALAREITAIGPLLVSCRPDAATPVAVACDTVRYPAFEGPAIECGVLKDIRHDAFFLVPWSNDVDRPQTGTITLPDKLLAGRKVYDLSPLREVGLTDGAKLSVQLPPGGGSILLLAAPAEFGRCRDTVLRHRVSYPRVLARVRLRRGVKPDNAAALQAQAEAAEAGKEWEKAAALYQQLIGAVDEAEKKANGVLPTRAALDRLAQVLSDSDDLLRCYCRLFGLPQSQAIHYSHVPNQYVGRQVRDWVALATLYFSVRQQCREGRYWDFLLHDTTVALEEWAGRNKQEIEAAIEKRLAGVRTPIKVALLTPDREEVEYHLDFSWCTEKCQLTWIAPDGKGGLVDDKGRAFSPGDYQVVWVHQLRYAKVPAAGAAPDPAAVLLPELVQGASIQAMKNYVQSGGGLVLSGLAGLYAGLLGAETVPPNRVRENSYFHQALTVGLAPAIGFEKHPLFAGLPAEGFFTNANFPEQNLFAEVAWEKATPSGRVVANEFDELFGRINEYAAVVEYGIGKGKVVVLGGRACDYTPGMPFSLKDTSRDTLRDRMRQVTLNALLYGAAAERFSPDERAIAAAPATPPERPELLPTEGWLFRTDPGNVGVTQQWYLPTLDTRDWKPIKIATNWESQGYDYDGFAWYRISVKLANRPGKKTLLHFGAVDEQAVVYLDGKRLGEHNEGLVGWDKPFAIDITAALGEVPQEHLLAVQVFDQYAAGGIWKPVFVRYE